MTVANRKTEIILFCQMNRFLIFVNFKNNYQVINMQPLKKHKQTNACKGQTLQIQNFQRSQTGTTLMPTYSLLENCETKREYIFFKAPRKSSRIMQVLCAKQLTLSFRL